MSHPPLMRFLGLPDDASDGALLGLPEETGQPGPVVRDALQERLRYLDRHPGGSDDEATLVRNALLEAALRLARGVDRTEPRTPEDSSGDSVGVEAMDDRTASDGLMITDFDREILSILVGCGGWNASSRGHLVHLAARNGVSPASFMRIAQGLSQLLHGGGFSAVLPGSSRPPSAGRSSRGHAEQEVSVSSDASGWAPADQNRARSRLSAQPVGDPNLERMIREDQDRHWVIYLLGLLLVLLLVGVIIVIPWSGLDGGGLERPTPSSTESAIAGAPPVRPTPVESEVGRSARASDQSASLWSAYPAPVPMDPLPPAPALLELHDWSSELDRLTERVYEARESPTETVMGSYEDLLERCANTWPLMGRTLRHQLARSCREPVIAASEFDVRQGLLGVLQRVARQAGALRTPEDLWVGSWIQGILGTIHDDPEQPRQLREATRPLLLMEKRPARFQSAGIHSTFSDHASHYLDQAFEVIVARAEDDDPSAPRMLEFWLLAQESLLQDQLLHSVLLDCITLILEQEGLGVDSGETALLARLISELDRSAGSLDSELLRMNLQDWFVSPRIGAPALRILTALLHASDRLPWWNDSLIPAVDATDAQRAAVLDRIESTWPAGNRIPRSPGVPITLADRRLLDDLLDRTRAPVRGDLEQMRRLVVVGHLSAAVEAFWKGAPLRARRCLAEADRLLDSPPLADGVHDSMRAAGSPAGFDPRGGGDPRFLVDGSWTTVWENARNKVADRKQALRQLRQFPPPGDIGQNDANTLASTALKSHPETRVLAQEIILEQFSESPNILVGLLNAVTDRPSREVHEFFTRLLVDEPLPPRASPSWPARVRIALVRQSWLHQRSELHDLENLASRYAALLVERLELISDGEVAVRLNEPPQDLLAQQADHIRGRMVESLAVDPIPGTLAELDRKRLFHRSRAESSLKQVVAELVAIADLGAYRTAQLRPDLHESLAEYHADLVFKVGSAVDILEQMILLEQAIAFYTDLRLEIDQGRSS
ncbi:MAG: hypothetical protein VX641_06515 [Planctomycetota bacterium]|nr:hypothetical protein [Planctomycetota bacterium]